MRIFLLIYTVLIIAGSVIALGLVPRSLRDLGQERQRLKESFPEAAFEPMVEAGYRMNMLLLLIEILYYYLLLRHSGDDAYLFWGAAVLGIIHIAYLVFGRLERMRLKTGKTRTGVARVLILLTATLTAVEVVYLSGVAYLLPGS